MNNTWLEYGKDKDDLVHVSLVKSGKTKLTCPYCDSQLVAKKGEIISHHFAHVSDTCNQYRKSDSELIPLYSCFPIYLTGSEHKAIKMAHKAYKNNLFNDRGGQSSFAQLMYNSKIKCPPERLSKKDLIKEISRGHFKGKYKVTQLGKLCAGALTIVSFFSLQKEQFRVKKLNLENQIKSTEGEENAFYKTESNVFSSAVNRLREASLYFLEIKTGKETFYKIGITSRKIEERLKEIRAFLINHFDQKITIKVLFDIPHTGRIERYFKVKHQLNLYRDLPNQEEYYQFNKKEITQIEKDLKAISKLPQDRGGTRKNAG